MQVRALLVCFTVLSLLGASAPVASATPITTTFGTADVDLSLPIEPQLQVQAAVSPMSTVRVIVQKKSTSVSSHDLATSAKGKLVEDFGVIPAFVADFKHGDVLGLARNPSVRYVSLNSVVKRKAAIDISDLLTTYAPAVKAPGVWNATNGTSATGAGVTVAVIDTGFDLQHPDFHGAITAVEVNSSTSNTADGYGHGTHVAGIVNSKSPSGEYIGVAPNAKVVGVKIADDGGTAYEADLIRGLDWVYQNRVARGIRVVNLSVAAGSPMSYAYSPTDAAAERLWFSGVTVVAAAGNYGSAQDAVWYAPANDPFVITVGCLDNNATAATADDSLCEISSRGKTQDGFAKPDVVAPGRKVVSTLASGSPILQDEMPERVTPDGKHFSLSGTSMSAPVVSGIAALLLERNPSLKPDDIKAILTGSAQHYPGQPDGAGAVNAAKAMQMASAHTWKVNQPVLSLPGYNVSYGLGTALWDGSRWSNASWDGSRWTNMLWHGSRWTAAAWDGSRWSVATWDGSRWSATVWDGSRWSATVWDGSRWSNATWDGSRWSSADWYGSRWSSAIID